MFRLNLRPRLPLSRLTNPVRRSDLRPTMPTVRVPASRKASSARKVRTSR